LFLGVEDLEKAKGQDRLYGIAENLEAVDELFRKLETQFQPKIEEIFAFRIPCNLRDGREGSILFLYVPPSKCVHSIVGGGTWTRGEKSNRQMTATEITELSYQRGVRSAESEPVDVDFDLLETETWRQYAIKRGLSSTGIADQLFRIGLAKKIEGELRPLRAAVLLFADYPGALLAKSGTRADVRVFHYRGNEKIPGEVPNLLKTPKTFSAPIYRLIEQTLAYVLDALAQGLTMEGSGFKTVHRYPERVVKEGITNALIHRDYRLNQDVQMLIFDNRLEIISPGLFPGRITAANIQKAGSLARNPLIARTLRDFPEPPSADAGEGVPMMFSIMKDKNLYPPEYRTKETETQEAVILTLLNEERPSEWEQVNDWIDRNGPISNRDVCKITHLDTLKASKQLKRWVELGLLETDPTLGKRNRVYRKPSADTGGLLSGVSDNKVNRQGFFLKFNALENFYFPSDANRAVTIGSLTQGKGSMENNQNRGAIPAVSITTASTGKSTRSDAFGMRPMQQRAYAYRGEQYLLIKSPPASGKSRALMFIALDKLHHQGLKQAIIVVPEKTIGASFHDEPLSQFGFFADWVVTPKWNLCNAPGSESGGKVKSLGAFLESEDRILVCTHATFRFAVDEFGAEAFDDRLIAVDEFHHVSANPDNKLGSQLGQFIARDRVHIVAMTGSYFRGDAEAVLAPQDESKFDAITYTYYEQLNGYEYLKQLDIGYYFYSGSYIDDILKVLDPNEKTIIHIPNVNSRESTKDKIKEVEHIIEELGDWQGIDPATGFQLVKSPSGRVLRIADLVDDDPAKRDRVSAALKNPAQKNNRDHVDIIIALGMAKEGFDWIWCEHALTVGYRASLTEIVQIIGRATRDAPGKTRARFTNLIAEPDASEQAVTGAVNDTLKAIAASLLMEQVLAPRFEFKPKHPNNEAEPGFDYGDGGYDSNKCNVGFNQETGQFQIEIKGLTEPKSEEASRICREDLNEVIASFVQDKTTIERGLFDEELVPEELTQLRMGKIIKEKYPTLDAEDQEAVRQHAIAALNLTQQAKQVAVGDGGEAPVNTALIDGVRKFAMDVRDLDIDLIDRINPFSEAYAILAKSMSEDRLKQVAAIITAKRTSLTPEEAKDLAVRAVEFKKEHGRLPSIGSTDPWEKRMAEGAAAFVRFKDEGRYD
jgi:predicted HTH transcriptional regulator/superfamily II DNA or RNA helicase